MPEIGALWRLGTSFNNPNFKGPFKEVIGEYIGFRV